MGKLSNTQTEKNILKAFAGESQARNRYTFFASVAKKENYQAIAAIFEETANHEKEHAERLFELLVEGTDLEITKSFPAGKIGTTIENLKSALSGEREERANMYPSFAEVARQEGFNDIANVFDNIAKAELYHEERFGKLLQNLEARTLFKKNELTLWKCTNCGFHILSKEAPKKCPSCDHDQGYFIEVNDTLF